MPIRFASGSDRSQHHPRSFLRFASVAQRNLCALCQLCVSIPSHFRLMRCHHAGNGTANRHEWTRKMRRCHARSYRLVFSHSLMDNCHRWTMECAVNARTLPPVDQWVANWLIATEQCVPPKPDQRGAFASLIKVNSRLGERRRYVALRIPRVLPND